MIHQKYDLFSELNPKQRVSFMLIAACFALWGFANDMTSTMASAFSKIFRMSVMEADLVVVANHLGYLVMGLPAALFIMKYRFKAGVLVGLAIYAAGALFFLPAKMLGTFTPFLLAYFTMTCGLAFLETSCHPMVYRMGSEDSGIGRINLAQSFNALGALIGMFVVRDIIQAGMSPVSHADRMTMPLKQFEIIKDHDLGVLIQPYVYIAAVIALLMVVIRLNKMDTLNEPPKDETLIEQIKTILKNKNYSEGVITQFFYVGAQVCCWAYIIQYGARIFVAEGIAENEAEMLAQKYNIAAMAMFAAFRFIFTYLLKFLAPGRLLSLAAITAGVFTLGVVLFSDRNGLYCLIIVSACMSLMFSTIYGISLRGLGNHVKLASAGMTMAVFGGAVFPAIQAAIMESHVTLLGLSAVNLSFQVPIFCFVVVALYGHRSYVRHYITKNYYD